MIASIPEARIVDAIVVLVVVEGLILVVCRARTGGGFSGAAVWAKAAESRSSPVRQALTAPAAFNAPATLGFE